MRRLLRWAFNFAAAVSALLFVATCVLWVRSHWRLDSWTRNWPNGTASVRSFEGRLMYVRDQAAGVTATGTTTLTGPPPGFHSEAVDPAESGSFVRAHPLGFVFRHLADPWSDQRVAMIPDWWAASLFALIVLARLAYQRRLLRSGRCLKCGYDLRATPGRCPECGTVSKATTT